ncbi:MAG TPA: hypothetical protein PLB19_02645 [Candidatus Paceibacterota bacterium]|nr:hypothetical protein [Candidatus Paceibacterota bacterium]
MKKVESIDKVFLEEKSINFTKAQLQEMGYETESIVTKDDLELFRQKFPELAIEDLDRILSLTIKKDEIPKIITFLGMLTAYTEDSQVNISFNAPASTGKSYIAKEVSKLFPEEDLIKVAYSSPTAFFHSYGEYNPENRTRKIDLSRKILIFQDQPHSLLLERLRPLLSHDQKELLFKITDKGKKGQNITKDVILIGYPVIIFCSASLTMDKQETSRVILLSPDIDREKIYDSIMQTINRQNNKQFDIEVENNPERKLLKERVRIIKNLKLDDVIIPDTSIITNYYQTKQNSKDITPADMRNILKIYSIIKGLALLNFAHREIQGKNLIANTNDIGQGFLLWKEIEKYQDLGISPFAFWFYENVFIPAFKQNNNEGLSLKDMSGFMAKSLKKSITYKLLRMEIIPSLLNAGLIEEDKNPEDRREKLYYPSKEI